MAPTCFPAQALDSLKSDPAAIQAVHEPGCEAYLPATSLTPWGTLQEAQEITDAANQNGTSALANGHPPHFAHPSANASNANRAAIDATPAAGQAMSNGNTFFTPAVHAGNNPAGFVTTDMSRVAQIGVQPMSVCAAL